MKQKNKQLQFSTEFAAIKSVFLVPKIKESLLGNGINELAYFDMEYVTASKFSDYFLDLTIIQLRELITHIKIYLQELKKKSFIEYVDKHVFREKLDEITAVLKKNGMKYNISVYEIINELRKNVPDKPLPIGFCHGDFTFSNMLFKPDKIYIYDFLDSFIESYIIDIVKLRQDTAIHWSLFIDDEIESFHKTKLKQILCYIDEVLLMYFSEDEYYNHWYTYLQKINLLRILPYLANPAEIEYVENQLIRIK